MALTPADFVHLHVHSEYSLLDGANRIGPMIEQVKRMGMGALALTDHGVLFGALDFHAKAKSAGIKPIVGCEVYITPKSRHDRGAGEQKNTHHLLLLAENYEGYLNICKLSSIGHLEGFYYKPRIDFETLEAHKAGVLATSSCLAGLIPQALMANDLAKAARLTGQFADLFGRERFFMELMDHGLREQKETNPFLIDLARRQNLRLIATNDCHYLTRADAEVHDVLLCVQTGARVADKERFRFDCAEFYVKSPEEMTALFQDIPEAITNTRLVAEMCNLEMPARQYHLPRFPCPDGKSEAEYHREKVWAGARERYHERLDTDEALRSRIEFELGVIEKMGFPSYFLIVADFIAYARSIGIPVGPGRGSAAGSVVAYALRITQLCPLEHDLLFERFLNPDRLSMPDIDIDFCFERRGEVIEYVRKKYGEDCVAQIITFGTMKAKAAVRDVGRVLDIPLNIVDRAAKAIRSDLKMTLPKAIEESPELRQMMDSDPQIARLITLATKVEGMVRHASTHAAGIVISDRPLTEYCPLYKSPNEDKPATQFTMTEVEESIGLLKMDFLGIKNLTIIRRVENWLRERERIEIDWDKIPLDDPETYKILQRGQTLGVFQLESEGMTALVKRLAPTEFADLTALLALYRPGPLQAGMDDMYVERKHGRQRVQYDHPILEPILRESYGVILYQEQVMRIAVAMCGFTRGDADVLRKAMGKKKADVMAKMEAQFIAGAKTASGVGPDLAKHIWDNIVTFAGYGFNKSHSAAYAMVTFQTAYLRAHYQTYFLAALLTNEIAGTTDAIAKYVSNCRELGIEVLPADVNRSIGYFNPDGSRVWYALNGVKGVGGRFAEAIVAEREANGPFTSLQDLCLRIAREDLNSRQVEALIKVGAFDSLEANRAALLAILPRCMELAADVQRVKGGGQDDLFGLGGGKEKDSLIETIPIPPVTPWDDKERAAHEKEFLGFYLSDHPLKRFRVELESFATMRSIEFEEKAAALGEKDRLGVSAVGAITDIDRRVDKNGNPWAIVHLEDLDGAFDCRLFSRAWGAYRDMLAIDQVVQIEGTLSQWNNRPSFDGQVVRRAEDLRASARGVVVEWAPGTVTRQSLFELTELCRRFGGARPIALSVKLANHGSAEFHPSLRVSVTPDSIAALQRLPGRPRVRLLPGKELAQRVDNGRGRRAAGGR
ncbi:DNA polymerase III subunit alpha [Candidatus Poribacteria bacterium]|nr:DNA polymerase III subunit alpha [Candidatus Poribacteria bacterium]